jgi:hypothetical protein
MDRYYPNHQILVRNARDLYRLAQNMQKIMLEMFLNEFIDLDNEEEKMRIQREE